MLNHVYLLNLVIHTDMEMIKPTICPSISCVFSSLVTGCSILKSDRLWPGAPFFQPLTLRPPKRSGTGLPKKSQGLNRQAPTCFQHNKYVMA